MPSELLKRCTVRIAKRWMDTSSFGLLISNAPADQVPGTSLKTNQLFLFLVFGLTAVSSLSDTVFCTENKNRDPGEREFLVDDQQIDREKLGETLPYLGQKLEWDPDAKELEAQAPNRSAYSTACTALVCAKMGQVGQNPMGST